MDVKISEVIQAYADANGVSFAGAQVLILMEVVADSPDLAAELAMKATGGHASPGAGNGIDGLSEYAADMNKNSNAKGQLTVYQALDMAQRAMLTISKEIDDKYNFIPPEEQVSHIERILLLAATLAKSAS
jgi:hypothetical protein